MRYDFIAGTGSRQPCNLLGGRLPVELNLYDVVIPERQIAVHDTVTLMDLVDDQSHGVAGNLL